MLLSALLIDKMVVKIYLKLYLRMVVLGKLNQLALEWIVATSIKKVSVIIQNHHS